MINLDYSPEISAALTNGTPIVALESTIITHGFPEPQNIEMARAVEAVIRDGGAVPATIAVMAGRVKIGLTDAELVELAGLRTVAKLSRADLAITLAMGGSGATTVAATMILAAQAGISVFATGGIGGVHRGAEQSFDISADLQELAQTSVTVISAGAKAILDIPKTLEVLETLGVPVITYQSDDFPAFWARQSGLRSALRMDSPDEIARAFATRRALGLPGGQLVANPLPKDAEIPLDKITPLIEALIQEAASKNISGKAVTPFLLSGLAERTNGRSVKANQALVLNNARLATEIAHAQTKLGAKR